MSDWGDYTPGPWELDVSRGEVYAVESGDRVFGLHSWKRPDARLISKAYLIPRLEAVLTPLDSYLTLARHRSSFFDPREEREIDSTITEARRLLEELRQP